MGSNPPLCGQGERRQSPKFFLFGWFGFTCLALKVPAGWFHPEPLAHVAKGGFRSRLSLLMEHLLPLFIAPVFPRLLQTIL